MTPREFVNKYLPEAAKAGSKYGVSPLALLAQAVAEIGYATSSMFPKTKNPGNITAYGATNEYWNGKSYTAGTGLKFRVYNTTQDGWFDKARLLAVKYPTAAKASFDIPAFAKAIAYSPYIDESNGDNRLQYQTNIIANAKAIVAALDGKVPNWATPTGSINKAATGSEDLDLKKIATWLFVGTGAAVAIGIFAGASQPQPRPTMHRRPRYY